MMNLAFNLHEDKSLCKSSPVKLHEIVSLWEVLDFYAERFGRVCMLLARVSLAIGMSRTSVKSIPHFGRPRQANLEDLQWIHQLLSEMGLKSPAICAKRLLEYLEKEEDEIKNWKLKELVEDLLKRIPDEFMGQKLLVLLPAEANLYETEETFLGKSIIEKFQFLATDASEAGNCLALGSHTACVFHLMRIMEQCLQKLGSDLDVPERITCEKPWQEILNQIRSRVKIKWPNERDSMRIKHESVIGHLETVKIAWRNPTMHPKALYNKREAQKIMNAVQAFVEDFSVL